MPGGISLQQESKPNLIMITTTTGSGAPPFSPPTRPSPPDSSMSPPASVDTSCSGASSVPFAPTVVSSQVGAPHLLLLQPCTLLTSGGVGGLSSTGVSPASATSSSNEATNNQALFYENSSQFVQINPNPKQSNENIPMLYDITNALRSLRPVDTPHSAQLLSNSSVSITKCPVSRNPGTGLMYILDYIKPHGIANYKVDLWLLELGVKDLNPAVPILAASESCRLHEFG